MKLEFEEAHGSLGVVQSKAISSIHDADVRAAVIIVEGGPAFSFEYDVEGEERLVPLCVIDDDLASVEQSLDHSYEGVTHGRR